MRCCVPDVQCDGVALKFGAPDEPAGDHVEGFVNVGARDVVDAVEEES